MKVMVCGQRSFGEAAAAAIAEGGHDVTHVVSPAWRDSELPEWADGGRRDRLRVWADGRAEWIDAAYFNADKMPAGVDLIVAAHSHNFISRRCLERTELGGVGYHPSLLPRHRGRDAVRWAVHMGDPVTGGSVYWLTENIDAGPLAGQDWCFIRPDDTASSLWQRELFPMGVRLLAAVCADLSAGRIVKVPQDAHVATWEPSWDRPPVYRPDLIELGTGAHRGPRWETDRGALATAGGR